MKILHEYNFRSIDRCLLKETKFLGRGKRRTESEIIAAQDHALQKKYLETQILQKKPRAKFEKKQEFDERLQHTKAEPIMKIELFVQLMLLTYLLTYSMVQSPS